MPLFEKEELYFVSFKTAAGWVGLRGTYRGISRMTLPRKSREQAIKDLGLEPDQAVYSVEYFKFSMEQIMAYFNGYKIDFLANVDLSQASPFERSVWEATRKIPYGETRNYLWVAQQIKKPEAPRAVGQALGKNPLPIIIPCHRVLTSDGKLGGYRGGLEMKRFLLNLESNCGLSSG
jgi:methylated-DNA-[protein]-cysteine S-methyltransferase